MPSRWWVGVDTTRPETVTPAQLHAAVTHWFDLTDDAHAQQGKPFSISPLVPVQGKGWGFEVGVLTREAESHLKRGAREIGFERLGHRSARVHQPLPLHRHTWRELLDTPDCRRWGLEFLTPVSFRTGGHSSPLPDVPKLVHSLVGSWAFADEDQISAPELSHADVASIWISAIHNANSTTVDLATHILHGMTGRIELECDDRRVGQRFGALVALAAYSGIGAGRYRGMGVTRVEAATSVERRERSGSAGRIPA